MDMTRRSAGFISKRPHKKSRGGCTTCKRKKVKCDEALPKCTYCVMRSLECIFPEQKRETLYLSPETTVSSSSTLAYVICQDKDSNNPPLQAPSRLVPAALTSSGQLTKTDFELLHHYKASTWKSLTVREEEVIHNLNREWVPQVSLSRSYLLYAILSISASHTDSLRQSKQSQELATTYRQKSLTAYTRALQNITTDNYETLLMTSLLMQTMVPPPKLPCDDTTILDWVSVFLSMTQGLRILASLKWASGIEKLSIYPIFCRELHPLPPPPVFNIPSLYRKDGPLGQTPEYPNSPATYIPNIPATRINPRTSVSPIMDMTNLPFRPQKLMCANTPYVPASWRTTKPTWQLPAPAFLPPSLMALLQSLVEQPDSGPLDPHRPTLLPVLHALSPIFLSLYYRHLTPDVYVRIAVLPTFFTSEFLALVRQQEPRALVVMAWWFAFVGLVPNMWWVKGVIPRVLQTVSNVLMRSNKKILMDAVEGAYRVVKLVETRGREAGARSVFEGWDGVNWDRLKD